MKNGTSSPFAVLTSLGVILAVVAGLWYWQSGSDAQPGYLMHGQAYRDQSNDVMVEVSGQIVRVLRDDRDGGLVQKFVLRTKDGLDVLVTHPYKGDDRVPVAISDFVVARGEYEWSETGGQVDWTSYDKPFSDRNGWVQLRGKKYD